jgi:cytochrome c oxidase subunit 2
MDRDRGGASRLRAVGTGAVLLSVTACGDSNFGFPEPKSTQGEDIAGLWRFSFIAAAAVGALVVGLILWSIFRYRARSGGPYIPRQTDYQIRLEILYSVVPALIVAVLFGYTYQVQRRVDRKTDGATEIHVDGFQWQWRFGYPAQGVEIVGGPATEGIHDAAPTMVVPVGRPVRIVLTSSDVVHAFWVPDFLFKKDNIPGRANEFQLTADEAGEYVGRCAEFCGMLHARMTFKVLAVPAAQFDAELARVVREQPRNQQ